ncbi:hypothetical protein LXA43DRAFT_724687 [Ganoderma leucocontextum]|nr:hypothetical protein LXA43DRAFT_724687 [Ganoderma leucocontextum]
MPARPSWPNSSYCSRRQPRTMKQAVANATKHLRVNVDGSDTSDGEAFAYKKQEVVDCDEYPKAVARFLKKVHMIARMPTQNAAQEAMELLLVIAQESMPEGKNQGGWRDARERFDKVVDEMFVLLAKKRKDLEGDAFDIKETLVELKGIAEGLEDFDISPTFEESIPLLESWVL